MPTDSRCGALPSGGRFGPTSGGHGGRPQKAGQLAGHSHGRHVGRLAALAQARLGPEEAVLGAPGDLQDMIGLILLTVAQRHTDARRASVLLGPLD
jgi:hypothetical protein